MEVRPLSLGRSSGVTRVPVKSSPRMRMSPGGSEGRSRMGGEEASRVTPPPRRMIHSAMERSVSWALAGEKEKRKKRRKAWRRYPIRQLRSRKAAWEAAAGRGPAPQAREPVLVVGNGTILEHILGTSDRLVGVGGGNLFIEVDT